MDALNHPIMKMSTQLRKCLQNYDLQDHGQHEAALYSLAYVLQAIIDQGGQADGTNAGKLTGNRTRSCGTAEEASETQAE